MKTLAALGFAAAILALPSTAAACHHTATKGAFKVSCEAGVTVYRHKAPALPRLSVAQATTELAIRERAETERQRIAAEARMAQRDADLREREIALEERRAYRDGRRGYVSFGSTFASPIIVNSPAAGFAGGVGRKH